MTSFSDSYFLRVLLPRHAPARGLDAVARRWRKLLDPYRPELHYMRGPNACRTKASDRPARLRRRANRHASGVGAEAKRVVRST
jgi:hypothetical protein